VASAAPSSQKPDPAPVTAKPAPNDPNRYLNAVREFADNVLMYGRDTYGPKQTPLFVDGLNVNTHEPVKWIAPNGDRWILSNLASQQNLLRTLDGLTTITGDPKYKQAAMDAIKYAFENLRSPNGLLYWGGHSAYDAGADRPCGGGMHELKSLYPFYELMWEVNRQVTKQFIEAFWSGHILDWSNLDMNRHGNMDRLVGKVWAHEYKGGPVFFEGKGISFSVTGSDLSYAAALLSKLLDDREPLVWAKRLSHRYVETRNPKIGISSYTYTRNNPSALQELLGDDLKRDLLVYGMEFPAYWRIVDWTCPLCQLLLGEMLGDDGREFTQWTIEELTAWGRVAYRKEDNSLIPMLIDGTNLEGYVLKKDSDCGPRGTVLKTIPAGPSLFWLYALAYRLTGNEFMWEMTRSIAKGNNFGDIGATAKDKPQLNMGMDCSESYALIGFLELYEKTKEKAFLDIAQRIGDNILSNRFYKRFLVLSEKHTYARVDAIEPLALLRLDTTANSRSILIPQIWPSWVFFESDYRHKGIQSDTELIYTLTGLTEPSISLYEATATGDFELVKLLVSEGADVNSKKDDLLSTPLHRAVSGGHINIVQFLLSKGAEVNVRGNWRCETPLHYAATLTTGRDIIELLLTKGADINAVNSYGDTPLQYAAWSDRKDVIQLLLQKGATIANIHIASYMGDLEKIEAFIKEGVDINVLDGHGYASLHYAVQNSQKEAIELLLAKGADVNVKDWPGQTPLDIAISQNRKDIVELLISKGADVNTTNAAGDTPLHYTVNSQSADKETIELLITKGANLNAKDNNGWTALFHAAAGGHKELVELLLTKGADANTKDNNGWTALHMAVSNKHKDVAKLLIAKGADVNAKSNAGYTPLYCAFWNYDSEMVESLVTNGADVNFIPKGEDPTLYYAVWRKDVNTVKLLVDHGAKFDVKDRDGWTSFRYAAAQGSRDILEFFVSKGADVSTLHMAACMGDLTRVRSFLEQGADINTKDELGWTPLYWAASTGRTEVAELLIAKGADIQAKTNDEATPLHQASSSGGEELVKLLISKNADVNAKNKNGTTPLHNGVSSGNRAIVELLLAKGANINAQNRNNLTPLHSAVIRGQKEIVEVLIAKGADVNAKNAQGQTPLQVAENQKRTEIADLLRKYEAKKADGASSTTNTPQETPKEDKTPSQSAPQGNKPSDPNGRPGVPGDGPARQSGVRRL
jgi:pectate lyase